MGRNASLAGRQALKRVVWWLTKRTHTHDDWPPLLRGSQSMSRNPNSDRVRQRMRRRFVANYAFFVYGIWWLSEAQNRFLTSRSDEVWLCRLHHKIHYKQKSNMKNATRNLWFSSVEVLKKKLVIINLHFNKKPRILTDFFTDSSRQIKKRVVSAFFKETYNKT